MAERQFVTFTVGNDLFGIDILLVREINRNLDITQVSRAPDCLRGLLNLRGQIVTVLDLRERLGFEKSEETKSSCCIVLKTSQELERNGVDSALVESTSSDAVGLFVDKIGDVISVNPQDIDTPKVHKSGLAKRFIEGVVKLDHCLLITLNIAAVLALDEDFAQA